MPPCGCRMETEQKGARIPPDREEGLSPLVGGPWCGTLRANEGNVQILLRLRLETSELQPGRPSSLRPLRAAHLHLI